MCPIWPLHLVIMYLLAFLPLWALCQALPRLTATFVPRILGQLDMDKSDIVNVTIQGSNLAKGYEFMLMSNHPHIANSSWNTSHYVVKDEDIFNNTWRGRIKVTGSFLGRTEILVRAKKDKEEQFVEGELPVIVTRPQRLIDKLFLSSVVIFVSLIFINFGCALHWPTVVDAVRRPVAPLIGLLAHFLFLPLTSYVLGLAIFPAYPALRLGMFFTGVCPAGGASNVWTCVLGGNITLSIAMTTISTMASFVLMPAWLFSLGQKIFAEAKIAVPYAKIAEFVFTLVVPLSVGLGMQRFAPRAADYMVRILKGLSTLLLLLIIAFAIVSNLYIFELFTPEILLAGMAVPWLGYVAGYAVARAAQLPPADALAVCIETGVQNTGIAVFLLRSALPQPEADLTTVIPVSVAIMTPLPMMMIFLYQKIRACAREQHKNKKIDAVECAPAPREPHRGGVATLDVD